MALTWYQSRERAWGSEFFFADFLFISCGMTLAIFRGILPAFLSIVFANFLMLVGAIIFPGQKLQGAVQAAEKLRKLIAFHKVDFINSDERITLSFGVAEITQGADFAALIKQADQALYLAKENGRNRVESAAK